MLDSHDERARSSEAGRFGIAGSAFAGTVTTSTAAWVQPATWKTTAVAGSTGNALIAVYGLVSTTSGTASQVVVKAGVAVDGASPAVAATAVGFGSGGQVILLGLIPAVGLAAGVSHRFQLAVAGNGVYTYTFASPFLVVWPL
jgi:hypothetical protein